VRDKGTTNIHNPQRLVVYALAPLPSPKTITSNLG
jgi:hypothetical protein